MDNKVFIKMATTGWAMVKEYCLSNRMSPQKLADVTGCDPVKVEKFLADSSFNLTGKEWERLMYECTSHPELWVYRAFEGEPSTSEHIKALAGATEICPNGEDDTKIQNIFAHITWFYQTASLRAIGGV